MCKELIIYLTGIPLAFIILALGAFIIDHNMKDFTVKDLVLSFSLSFLSYITVAIGLIVLIGFGLEKFFGRISGYKFWSISLIKRKDK